MSVRLVHAERRSEGRFRPLLSWRQEGLLVAIRPMAKPKWASPIPSSSAWPGSPPLAWHRPRRRLWYGYFDPVRGHAARPAVVSHGERGEDASGVKRTTEPAGAGSSW